MTPPFEADPLNQGELFARSSTAGMARVNRISNGGAWSIDLYPRQQKNYPALLT